MFPLGTFQLQMEHILPSGAESLNFRNFFYMKNAPRGLEFKISTLPLLRYALVDSKFDSFAMLHAKCKCIQNLINAMLCLTHTKKLAQFNKLQCKNVSHFNLPFCSIYDRSSDLHSYL